MKGESALRAGAKLILIFIIAGFLTTFFLSWLIEFYKYEKKLTSAEDFAKNLQYIMRTIKEVYPKKLSQITISELDKLLSNARNTKKRKLHPIEAFSLVQPALSILDDENLKLSVPNDPIYSVLPFTVKVIDKNIIVSTTATERIPVGAYILAVNGVKKDELINLLLPYTSGNTYESREQQLPTLFWLSPELLWKKKRFVWIFYNQEEYIVEYLIKNEKKSTKVKTVTLFSYPKLSAQFDALFSEAPYSFDRIGNVGIIKIRTFSLSGVSYNKFREFLDNAIVYNKDLDKIVIDIRGSSAQEFTIFKEVLEHFIQHPLSVKRNIVLINSAYVLKTLEKYGIDYEKTTGEAITTAIIHNFEPRDPNIKAEVWLLFDKYTGNAALDFAYTFKKLFPGKTIGEPTLSKINHTTDMFYQFLDGLGSVFYYPTSAFNESDGEKSLEPDVKIEISSKDRIEYLLSGRDEIIQRALTIVNR
jgi:hypothetical protein